MCLIQGNRILNLRILQRRVARHESMQSVTQVNIREVMLMCPELKFGPQVNVTESICFIEGIQ
jgi:hypothetical protein